MSDKKTCEVAAGGGCQQAEQVGAVAGLRDEVATVLKHDVAGPKVFEAVKARLVEEELTSRTNLVLQGLTRQKEHAKALALLTPDSIVYAADGSVASEGYTKARLDQRAALQEKLDAVTNALNVALGQGSYCCLRKAVAAV